MELLHYITTTKVDDPHDDCTHWVGKMMNKRLENKITCWYGSGLAARLWIARHWYRWIEGTNEFSDINSPKGFAEMSEYCYNTYWKVKDERRL